MTELYADSYIDFLYEIAYIIAMDQFARTPQQIGSLIRRLRRQAALTQHQLGQKMGARQATVSKLESGEPATQLKILMDALAALDLELVIRTRSKAEPKNIEDIF
jgi:HTH-type transcriptional regulator/antitoxin HipB